MSEREKRTTVLEYAREVFGPMVDGFEITMPGRPVRWDEFVLPVDSNCGRDCVAAIDRAEGVDGAAIALEECAVLYFG